MRRTWGSILALSRPFIEVFDPRISPLVAGVAIWTQPDELSVLASSVAIQLGGRLICETTTVVRTDSPFRESLGRVWSWIGQYGYPANRSTVRPHAEIR